MAALPQWSLREERDYMVELYLLVARQRYTGKSPLRHVAVVSGLFKRTLTAYGLREATYGPESDVEPEERHSLA